MTDRASFSSDSIANDALLAGSAEHLIERKVTLVSGQNVVRGTVLAVITASGKYTTADVGAAGGDGSAVPVAIAAEDCDASGGDASMMIYVSGIFNETELTFGGTDDADDVRAALHDRGIYLRKGMA